MSNNNLPPPIASTPPSPSRRKTTTSSTAGTVAAPIRPSSPSCSVSTGKSSANNSPRPFPTTRRQSYRRGSSTSAAKLAKSTSNASLSRSGSNTNILASFDALLTSNNENNTTPVTTPRNNSAHSKFTTDGVFPLPDLNATSNTILPDPQNPDHRKSLPRPLPPSKCPLLCVFYAEFDIVVGPKVCFQSPQKFMHFDVDVSNEDVDTSLEETFQAVLSNPVDTPKNNQGVENINNSPGIGKSESGNKLDPDDYWNWSPNTKTRYLEREVSDISSQITLPSSGHPHKDDRQNSTSSNNAAGSVSGTEASTKDSGSGQKKSLHQRKKSGASITGNADDSTSNNATNATAQMTSSHSRNPSFGSSKGTASNQQTHEGDTSTIDTELMANSIFAATSEYIITGNELANQTITVSTHGMHILSRPMIIIDEKRYERNNLLFAVGFVLRRNVDPRPYWPVLSNLSSTFRAMEVESQFLSHANTRPQIQIVLEDILVSLNSKRKDCHLLLDDANILNLQLFRPPPPPTSPVPDYAVPILLRPEWQLQMYDWDLTINWIVPHIDGCKYVKQIAVSSEVDMEMVRACLRVLRHHGVLAHVDVFRYSNVYECTPLATRLLTGAGDDKKSDEMEKLMDAAFWYCAKAKYVRRAQMMYRATNNHDRSSPNLTPSSPSNLVIRKMHNVPHMSSLHSLDLSVGGSPSTPWATAVANETSSRHRRSITEEMSTPRSFPSRTGHITIREEHSMEEEDNARKMPAHVREIATMKKALAQLYSSCSRSQTFGEMLLAKVEGKTDQSTSDEHTNEKIVAKNFVETALTPLREFSESETSAKQPNSSKSKGADDLDVDWKLAFDYFDHRRLITFGVVRGLIRRVHQYPLATVIGAGKDGSNTSRSGQESAGAAVSYSARSDHADDLSNMDLSSGGDHYAEPYQFPSASEQYHIPIEMSAMVKAAEAASNIAMDDRSRSTSYSASPLIQGIPGPQLNSRDEMLLSKLAKKDFRQQSKKMLLQRIASAMDGTRCDDELSCMFESPIERLIEMLKDSGRWHIISVFSCTN